MKVLLFVQLTLIVQLVWAADFDFSALNLSKKFKKAQVIEEGHKMQLKIRPETDPESLVVGRGQEKEFKVSLRRQR